MFFYINAMLAVCSMFIIIVFVHEFGHYFFCKILNVDVEELSIGFGKSLLSIEDKSGTQWKICRIPLGGYVKIKGYDDKGSDTEIRSFKNAGFFKKILILMGGSVFNYLFAIIMMTTLTYNTPSVFFPPIIGEIIKDSPASNSGLMEGDKILYINEIEIENFIGIKDALFFLQKSPSITMTIERDSKVYKYEIYPTIQELAVTKTSTVKLPYIGIAPKEAIVREKRGIFQSLKTSAYETFRYAFIICKSLLFMASGDVETDNIGSVISISKMSIEMFEMGLLSFIFYMVMLSINLGTLNLLPIIPLDGGRILQLLIKKVFFFNKVFKKNMEIITTAFGVIFLSLLTIFAIFNDIIRYF